MANQKPLILSSTGQVQRLPAADLVDPAALAIGTADSTTYLRGDGTWATPSTAATSLALSSLTAATTTNTIASGDNAQVWQWALTSIVKSALTLTESAAAINGGSSQILLDIATVASSTATPFRVAARGSEAFRVNADGKIGIGTSTFTNTVDSVVVRQGGNGVDLGGSASSGAVRLRGDATTGAGVIDFTPTTHDLNVAPYYYGRLFYDFNTNSLAFHTNSVERMRIDSAGRVGVGTNNPVDWLHCAGSIGSGAGGVSDGTFQLRRASDGVVVGTFAADTTNSVVTLTSGYETITFRGSSLERMRIDSAGNVGVGVAPSTWGANYKVIQNPAGAIAGYGALSIAYAQNAYDDTAGTWKYTTSGVAAGFYNQSQGYHSWYTAPTGTAGAPITFAQVMTLNANGNLGVGASSPQSATHVHRSSAAGTISGASSLILQNDNSTSGTFLSGGVFSSTWRDVQAYSITAGVWFEKQNSAVNGVLASQGAIVFGAMDTGANDTLPTERMRLDSSGRLGIGTATLTEWLTVKSPNASTFVSLQTATDSGVYIGNNGGALVLNTATVERMRIDSAGNVGIGVTPNPWGSMFKTATVGEVASSGWMAGTTTTGELYTGGNCYHNGTNWIYVAAAPAQIYRQGSGEHQWHNAPSGTAGAPITFTQAMTLDVSGKLLIGTTTAGASKLTVADNSIQINTSKTPASATDTGTTGQIAWDANYVYVCVATNTWKRSALTTW